MITLTYFISICLDILLQVYNEKYFSKKWKYYSTEKKKRGTLINHLDS